MNFLKPQMRLLELIRAFWSLFGVSGAFGPFGPDLWILYIYIYIWAIQATLSIGTNFGRLANGSLLQPIRVLEPVGAFWTQCEPP